MAELDALFEPITLNKTKIRNRVVCTPHGEGLCEPGGMPGDRYNRYHAEKARGGLGIAMISGSTPVSIDSPLGWGCNLAVDEVIEPLTRTAEAIHAHGAATILQLTHMGRRNAWNFGDWPHLVSPSGLREPIHRATCKTIEQEEIARIIEDYGRAARRCQMAGLDGVEISAAHNHLIDQFWSPRSNIRTDGYGGSLENRMRFGIEAFERVRAHVGPDFIVGLRMSGDEFHENGLGYEDLAEIARRMAETGMVDYISVIGSSGDTHNVLAHCIPDMSYPPQPFLHLASGLKQATDLPILHAQNIKDPNQAARILDEGHVDLVGMTRASIADPHFMNKTRAGQLDRIKQCVGANYCINRIYVGLDVLCIQNPATSREGQLSHFYEAAEPRRRVVVAGGGPAGMEAARVAAERGNDVVLFEKADQLGGQINIAKNAPARDQLGGISRWLSMEIERLGVDIRLNTRADADSLKAEAPDIVIIATGGRSRVDIPEEWGHEDGRVVSSWEILSGAVTPADNVLVYDEISNWAGATAADYIANQGALVEIVTPEMRVGEGLGGTTFPTYLRRFHANDVVLTPDFWLTRTYREGNRVIAVLENEYTRASEEREIDQIVVENGTRPDETLYYALKEEAINKGQTDLARLFAAQPQPVLDEIDGARGRFALFRIGDCVSHRNIHAAMYDAQRLVKDF